MELQRAAAATALAARKGATASEVTRSGVANNTSSSKAEDVDAGSVTDALLLPTDPHFRELRFTAPRTHFLLNQTMNHEVSLNPALPDNLHIQENILKKSEKRRFRANRELKWSKPCYILNRQV